MDESSPLHRAFSQALIDALSREVTLRAENIALRDALERVNAPQVAVDPAVVE